MSHVWGCYDLQDMMDFAAQAGDENFIPAGWESIPEGGYGDLQEENEDQ